MLLRAKEFFKILQILLLSIPLFLTGCHSDFGPFPMPTGYKYLDSGYKAPPGPEPVFERIQKSCFLKTEEKGCDGSAQEASAEVSSEEQSVDSSSYAVSGQWDYAARDLLGKLRNSFGIPLESTYIKQPENPSADTAAFERVLRIAMQESGFVLAAESGASSFMLRYTITDASLVDGQHMIVVLVIETAGQVVAEASGLYDVGFSSPMQEMPVPHQYGGGDASMEPGEPVSISPVK